jgi:hypothetical protein
VSQFLHLTSDPDMWDPLLESEHIKGRQMRSVTVRVPAADLAREMVLMREWLDLNQCDPTRFDCGKNGAEVVLFVAFSSDIAAEGFARRFGGESAASAYVQG